MLKGRKQLAADKRRWTQIENTELCLIRFSQRASVAELPFSALRQKPTPRGKSRRKGLTGVQRY
jgi:hypothetical protein